jgi:hypothetical protein
MRAMAFLRLKETGRRQQVWVVRMLPALCAAFFVCAAFPAAAQAPLYEYRAGERTHWASPENPEARKGGGGTENKGAKGHAFETIPAGGSHVLADIRGAGVIDRMWITVDDRSPERLRALRLDIYWDGAKTPAVSVPLGDLFGGGAGNLVPMETALVASPEGRSFVSYIPMPFRTGARVVIRNESAKELSLIFYDVNFRKLERVPENALYFHAWWSRDPDTEPGRDFQVLPRIEGHGRFLGMLVTTFTDPRYGKTWWGEGEAKIYLDGDAGHATLVGTGTEDYIGTAWGQGAYVNRYQGAPLADEARGRWSYYRFHVPDPIFFERDLRVDLQQIGGAPKKEVIALMQKGVPLTPVTIDPGRRTGFRQLLATDPPTPVTAPGLPEGWTNFYRSDDVSAVALFYLDRPENGLPPLAPVAERTAALRPPPAEKPAGSPAP